MQTGLFYKLQWWLSLPGLLSQVFKVTTPPAAKGRVERKQFPLVQRGRKPGTNSDEMCDLGK